MRFPFAIFFVALLAPNVLFAAQVTILPEQKAVIENAEFQTDITINTGNESINTFSGVLAFPSDLIALKEIRTGGSIINYWVEGPRVDGNTITFAGMTPGGFTGSRGVLFSLVFTAINQGDGSINITGPLFLKNDGLGTEAKISVSNSSIQVLAPDLRRDITIAPIEDKTPPEMFTPTVNRSPLLYNNAWLLFFTAQDKGSGVDHYEVTENAGGLLSFFAPWKRATSPYLLEDQSASSNLAIRAIDKAGNIRTVHLAPLHPRAWYANLTNWFFLVGIIVIIITLKQIIWRKR